MQQGNQDPASKSAVFNKAQAQSINFASSHFLADLMKTNIGPYGKLKLLETDIGDLSLTSDGETLVKKLTFVHPTALFIARAARAQADHFHDGVSSIITLIDGILKQSDYKIQDGVHPRMIVKGLEIARDICLKSLNDYAIHVEGRPMLREIAQCGARTRHAVDVANICVDAVAAVQDKPKKEGDDEDSNETKPQKAPKIDIDRLDIMRVKGATQAARLVKGIVLEQGYRSDNMPKRMTKVRILALNVSLELEPSAVATFAPIANADQRERMQIAERRFVDDKVRKIIELKDVIDGDMLVVNGKGIDGPALDILSHAGIAALRRVSNSAMRRFVSGCGCRVVNCVDDLHPSVLGFAGKVTEETFRRQKYVYVDEVGEGQAATVVIGGANEQSAGLVKEAVIAGVRAVQHAVDDTKVLPGGGAIEALLSERLDRALAEVAPSERIGVEVMREALLELPRVLAENAGHDAGLVVAELLAAAADGDVFGLDSDTGEVVEAEDFGLFDNFSVKRAIIQSAPIVASQLLLVDQIIEVPRAPVSRKQKAEQENDAERKGVRKDN